jgi:stage II sporulation protein M
VAGWYRNEVAAMIRRLAIPLLITIGVAALGYWGSYSWTIANVPSLLPRATSDNMAQLVRGAGGSIGLAQAIGSLSLIRILANNMRALGLVFLAGLVSFGVLGVTAYLVNVGLVGAVMGFLKLMGLSPLLFFGAGLLPHGLFEVPALMLASATVLRAGAAIVSPQPGKSMGQVALELFADSAKVFCGVVCPLLVVAALIEAYITPLILSMALT